ncbi:MAG: sodium-calcium exchanger [Candidatus Methanoperedens nitroreducens]|uniref:Sodium-calcium exchanger n=1 Tax=Candidatus Methanoperedens nitratireducens TaxID=1392998 RepID=A0A0P8A4J5_9EURY|nr:calcium/sodium antiporter [Candidatus Methanoperedens sp. BLZ2]KAB2948016.1 MAG: calcium/sodium antiporter [Candidatus Methanoperedens sp.]KPQ43077.1 MAG: sodium-calcium exchanger [Candidatus Methanoperedens sp. BLZ1]MBZ0176358.1 calcium/sodium antiporter [Candidatus Methanoperedens nitroreducens]MCX9080199.1 calcium/sodium antiporter [Candidatus Methanoperedens sp.]
MPTESVKFLIFFIISIPIIIKSSDIFTEGASKLAKTLGVSDFVIGITVVALGTSLPELASDIYASYIDHGQIVVGDIIGSNITNIGLILGLTCIIKPLAIKHTEIYSGKVHLIILTLASSLLLFTGGIGRSGGAVLIILYIFYLRHSIITSRELGVESLGKNGSIKNILEVIIGLTGILIGARILVNSIIGLSMAYDVPEYLIALLLMSIGTSLPELFVSVSAARKGYMTMALGNIIGSNVANILWVLGAAAVIRPIIIAPELILTQVLIMLLLSVLLIIFKKSGYMIDRREGAIFLGIYVIFVIVSIAFGNDFKQLEV